MPVQLFYIYVDAVDASVQGRRYLNTSGGKKFIILKLTNIVTVLLHSHCTTVVQHAVHQSYK